VVDHFMRFLREDRTLPVVWHQSLLVFIQRYDWHARPQGSEEWDGGVGVARGTGVQDGNDD